MQQPLPWRWWQRALRQAADDAAQLPAWQTEPTLAAVPRQRVGQSAELLPSVQLLHLPQQQQQWQQPLPLAAAGDQLCQQARAR